MNRVKRITTASTSIHILFVCISCVVMKSRIVSLKNLDLINSLTLKQISFPIAKRVGVYGGGKNCILFCCSIVSLLWQCYVTSLFYSFGKPYLIVTLSAHGTFLGHIRLEAHKPQQVPIDSTLAFGASTRTYIIREKPQTQGSTSTGDNKTGDDEELKGLLGLPEEETELDVRYVFWSILFSSLFIPVFLPVDSWTLAKFVKLLKFKICLFAFIQIDLHILLWPCVHGQSKSKSK